MNNIIDCIPHIWERQTTATNITYKNASTGTVISRRAFEDGVNSGQYVNFPEGTVKFIKRAKFYPQANTYHIVYSTKGLDTSSVRQLGTAVTSPNLAANESLMIKIIGTITDITTGIARKLVLQTAPWDSVAQAVSEYLEILDSIRRGSQTPSGDYSASLSYCVEEFEVILRRVM